MGRVTEINGVVGKTCPRCETWKPVTQDNWNWLKTAPDGLSVYCKNCLAEKRADKKDIARARAARWYEDNKDRAQERMRSYAKNGPRKQKIVDPACASPVYQEHANKAAQECRDYHQEWHKKNRNRKRETNRRWVAANRERSRAKGRRYYWRHLDDVRERSREKHRNYPHLQAMYSKRYNQSEKGRLRQRQYAESNRPRQLAHGHNYRARKRALEGCFTSSDISALYEAQNGLCAYCDVALNRRYHVDHKMPVSRHGSNWPDNLALACQFCNLSKRDKTDVEFHAYRAAIARSQQRWMVGRQELVAPSSG